MSKKYMLVALLCSPVVVQASSSGDETVTPAATAATSSSSFSSHVRQSTGRIDALLSGDLTTGAINDLFALVGAQQFELQYLGGVIERATATNFNLMSENSKLREENATLRNENKKFDALTRSLARRKSDSDSE